MKLLTYKYVFRIVGDPEGTLKFRIVSDVAEGHAALVKQLIADETIELCLREYLHEYNCSLVGSVESLKGSNKIEEE